LENKWLAKTHQTRIGPKYSQSYKNSQIMDPNHLW